MPSYENKLAMSKQRDLRPLRRSKWRGELLLGSLLAAVAAFCACGNNPPSTSQNNPLSGNWEFTMAAPSDGSFVGGLEGGFLLQSNGAVTGGAVYSIALPPSQTGATATVCNSGSASVTGTIDGQNVTLTATAGAQTFSLTGTLSSDQSTMTGTYKSTDGQGFGTAQGGLRWRAVAVPSVTGVVQGSFHSTGSGAVTILKDQDFSVTGSLVQETNIGASAATVTGTLTFQAYPCMSTASVNGQISGNSLILQIITPDGLNAGEICAIGSNGFKFLIWRGRAPGCERIRCKYEKLQGCEYARRRRKHLPRTGKQYRLHAADYFDAGYSVISGTAAGFGSYDSDLFSYEHRSVRHYFKWSSAGISSRTHRRHQQS